MKMSERGTLTDQSAGRVGGLPDVAGTLPWPADACVRPVGQEMRFSPRTPGSRAGLTPIDGALYIAVILAWGFAWIAMHYQVGVVAPEVSVVWRFLLAAPLMFALAVARGERLRFAPRDHVAFLGLGIALFGANFALFYYSAQWLPSGLLAVVFSLASVINGGLGALVLGTALDRRGVLGGTLGVGGVALLFAPQLAATRLEPRVLLGLALCVGGTLSFCVGNLISAQLQRRKVPVVAGSAWGMLYGAAALALWAALRDQPFTLEPRWPYLAGLGYLALVASVLAFACYLTLLGRIGVDRAAYVTVVLPVVALAVSTLLEGYRWTLPAGLGLAAVLAGNLLVLRLPRRSQRSGRPGVPVEAPLRILGMGCGPSASTHATWDWWTRAWFARSRERSRYTSEQENG